MVECTIDWSAVTMAAWDEQFGRISRSTLLQHYPYAQANQAVNQSGARHGVIMIDGQAGGLVQLSEAGVFNKLIHAMSLDRGPLWFDGFGDEAQWAAFFKNFSDEFPHRWGRKLRLLPELVDKPANQALLSKAGFSRRDGFGNYETVWLDLTPDQDRLRAKLKGKWRYDLSKSEGHELVVTQDWAGHEGLNFLRAYEADRLAKNYPGPPVKMLKALLDFMVPRNEALILTASVKSQPVAAILILLHGRSATCQSGWTSQKGRKLAAHNQLYWRAMLALKAKGIKDFDLGGVNDESAAGVKRFKMGMGGKLVTLAGFYGRGR